MAKEKCCIGQSVGSSEHKIKSLYDEIKDLDNWNYYFKDEKCKKPAWNTNTEHQQFIENFLKTSGKESILDDFFTEDLKKSNVKFNNFDRAIHTNSVFFIGCLLYEKLLLKDKINFIREDGKNDEFHFIWFLTSLVHDFGYFAERDKSKFPEITEKISSIKREHDLLDYRNSNKYLIEAYTEYQESTRRIIDYIPNYFKEAFQGKRSSRNESKIEHGIYAGLLLYDGLVRNRLKKAEDSTLYWKPDLDKFYAIASFSIAIHNMRRDGIIDNPNELKFSIDDEPYLFLFALADTIEPIKFFEKEIKTGDITVDYILKNILIDITENAITLQNAPESKLDFTKIICQVGGLSNWLDVKNYYDGNNITILINAKKYQCQTNNTQIHQLTMNLES